MVNNSIIGSSIQAESSIQWDHSHDFGVDNKHRKNKVKIVFCLTTVIMVLEIGAGTWSGSMALLADGWHMGTHSAAFAITIFAYLMPINTPTIKHSALEPVKSII